MRVVSSKDQDKIVPDYKLLDSLVILLKELNCCSKSEYPVGRKSTSPQSVMYNVLGYEINRLNSSIPGAGRGVFVTKGQVPGGSLVALYPGVNTYTCIHVYMPTLLEESSGYGTDLPLSHMGHQICRIKSSQNVNFFNSKYGFWCIFAHM